MPWRHFKSIQGGILDKIRRLRYNKIKFIVPCGVFAQIVFKRKFIKPHCTIIVQNSRRSFYEV